MLKKKSLKIAFVLTCIVTLLMPYASTVLAATLTHEKNQTVKLGNYRIHKGGDEASETLTEEQARVYDTGSYEYEVGGTRVYKIVLDGDTNYSNAFYCLNAKKSFPGTLNEDSHFVSVADLKDSTDANVKALHLSTSSANTEVWNANYKSLMWLIENMYLPTETPEQKDDYLAKAFNGYTNYTMDVIKATLTDDDIDVVQQYAMWYFTNRDSSEFNVTTYPSVDLTKYEVVAVNGGTQTIESTQSYSDWGYPLRQEFADTLYKYLITSATNAASANGNVEAKTYPTIDYTTVANPSETITKDGYFVAGPFKINAGTAASTEYNIELIDQDENKVTDYKILIEGEQAFTTEELKNIVDRKFYVYIPTTNESLTSFNLRVSYYDYETNASLWKNSTTKDGVEIYQPVTLVTRENLLHKQDITANINRKKADLALRKYIVKVNDKNVSRAPEVKVDGLKNGTSTTAEYKHAKNPIEVSVGDKIVYEIRVYNEGDIAGKATEIVDSLPNGLELAQNSTINNTYGWQLASENTVNGTAYATAYLNADDKVVAAFNKETGAIDSKYVQIECVVTNKATASLVLTNIAEIAVDNVDDIDSTVLNNEYITKDYEKQNYKGHVDNTNKDLSNKDVYFKGIEDDDDFEKLIVKGKSFDLSLQKFITKINEKAPDPVRIPKVDISKLKAGTSTNATYTTVKNPVTVKKGDIVLYTLRVYNEGEVAGYAEEVADYLPEGLGFLVNYKTNIDNYWSIPQDSKTVKLSTIENGTANLSIDDFTGITNLADVDVVVGKAKLTSIKLKSVDTDTKNLIKAFDKETGTALDYKDIQVACIVLADTAANNNFKNIAEIVKETDENRKVVTDIDSTPNTVDQNNYPGSDASQDDNDYEDLMTEDPKVFDLSLQKFITKLNDKDVNDRSPIVSKNEDGTLRFNHTSDALPVCYNDLVTFTIRVYNEGDLAGYAKEVIDYVSTTGLEFVKDNETNKKYGWTLYDANGNQTDKVDQAVTVRTKYLSKEESEKRNENNLINAFDKTKDVNSSNPDFRDLQIVFKVVGKATSETKDSVAKREFLNKAEIFDDQDSNGNAIDDKDSVPNNNKDAEDDIDSDKVYVKYFDLKLKKDLVKIIITENGKTREVNVSGTDALQKVEIHRKRINTTIVKFVYNITVTNEGEIAGYATEIKDYIPEGLEFNSDENKQWTKGSDNTITTNALAGTLLEPGKSAAVSVTLKWINGENNFGLKTNVAEISADKNDSNTPDIDSTPNNKVDGEDDIDKAEVMLFVSTGVIKPKYMWLATAVLAMWATGIVLIKKYVL